MNDGYTTHDALHRGRGPSDIGFTLMRDHWGQLVMRDSAGQTHENVRVVPLFPLSAPNRWISICDAEGRELACVEDPHQLAPSTCDVLEDELSRREFVPIIRRILRVSGNAEPTEWEVETDRGPTRFVLVNEEDVRRLDKNQVTIVDANGIRYLIADVRGLDSKSRRFVEWYV